jgi:hypothetical protein
MADRRLINKFVIKVLSEYQVPQHGAPKNGDRAC